MYRRRETKLPYVHCSTVVFSDLRPPDMPRRGVLGWARFWCGTPGGHLGALRPMPLPRLPKQSPLGCSVDQKMVKMRAFFAEKTISGLPVNGHKAVQFSSDDIYH